MSESTLKNLLVIGNLWKLEIRKVIKLFGTYLEYESIEEAAKWQPNLYEDNYGEGLEKSVIITEKNKMKLLCTDNLAASCNSQVFFSTLPHFQPQRKLNGIIALLMPVKEDYIRLQKFIFSVFPQFDESKIIYVFMYNNLEQYDNFFEEEKHCVEMRVLTRQDKKIFHFDIKKFYEVSHENWLEGVEISKSLDNYIADYCKNSQLYISDLTPEKNVLQLIDDLLEFLNYVYICATNYTRNRQERILFCIDDYKTNATSCYGNCIEWKETAPYLSVNSKIKIAQMCHGPCKCTKFDNEISKCIVFDYDECLRCNCKLEFHSRNYVHVETKRGYMEDEELKLEKNIAINILGTFHLYKEQNQQTSDVKNRMMKCLDLQDNKHKGIFSNFQNEFNNEVRRLKKEIESITDREIINCINKLWKLRYVVEDNIPAILGDIIQQVFQVNIVIAVQNDKDKEKILMLRNQTSEIKGETKINKNLNTHQDDPTLQTMNNLNSEVNQDEHLSIDNININQNEEKNEDKELNLNIEPK